jgi:hypothetical protein
MSCVCRCRAVRVAPVIRTSYLNRRAGILSHTNSAHSLPEVEGSLQYESRVDAQRRTARSTEQFQYSRGLSAAWTGREDTFYLVRGLFGRCPAYRPTRHHQGRLPGLIAGFRAEGWASPPKVRYSARRRAAPDPRRRRIATRRLARAETRAGIGARIRQTRRRVARCRPGRCRGAPTARTVSGMSAATNPRFSVKYARSESSRRNNASRSCDSGEQSSSVQARGAARCVVDHVASGPRGVRDHPAALGLGQRALVVRRDPKQRRRSCRRVGRRVS